MDILSYRLTVIVALSDAEFSENDMPGQIYLKTPCILRQNLNFPQHFEEISKNYIIYRLLQLLELSRQKDQLTIPFAPIVRVPSTYIQQEPVIISQQPPTIILEVNRNLNDEEVHQIFIKISSILQGYGYATKADVTRNKANVLNKQKGEMPAKHS
ncbi:uncharacterized protein LOC123292858 [Chrysoperla carnea]|uniref:uncharacterized protein LOC123292858 n=1 Tax=Chrysoperla carnea TaxID=189513 RepID=UPI001D08FA7B|nr:uncharacterized protein LOC123292858 [Chrysoperla carnea]